MTHDDKTSTTPYKWTAGNGSLDVELTGVNEPTHKEVRTMAQDNKPLTLTEKNFHKEVLDSSRPVLVDFWAGWCRPCHAVAPAIEELAEDFNGTAKVGKVDVEDQQALAESFHVHSIPTLLFFRNGEVVDRAIGAVSKAVLAGKLANLIKAA